MSVKTLNFDKKQKGFSLLELLLVVAVGAVLILAGLAAYRLVSENNNVNESLRLINTIKQQVQRAYQSEGSYTGNIVTTLIDLRAFPAGVLAGATPRHPFGGDITIAPVAGGNSFTITFEDIERSACIAIGQTFDTTADSDFVSLEIDDENPDADDDGITLADLQAGCPAGDAAGVPMAWTFF